MSVAALPQFQQRHCGDFTLSAAASPGTARRSRVAHRRIAWGGVIKFDGNENVLKENGVKPLGVS